MSSISAVSSSSGPSTDAYDSVAARVPQKTLGQDDFLKLLAKQFQVQDPMKPMEDTAFIAQMAQFSALENSKLLARDLGLLRAEQERTTATSYLGHRVTVDVDGESITGEVTAIDVSSSSPKLVVNGEGYPISAVLRVEPGLVSAPAPQPANTGGTNS